MDRAVLALKETSALFIGSVTIRLIEQITTTDLQDFLGRKLRQFMTHPFRIVRCMGSGERITCNTCDLKADAMLGIGFAGIPRILCACDTCKNIQVAEGSPIFGAEAELSKFFKPIGEAEDSPVNIPLICSSCRNPLRRLQSIFQFHEETEDFDIDHEPESRYGPCPRCGGELSGRFNGILWD